MQRLLWFPLYIDHFLASKRVLQMTIGEQGAYLRLLMFAWTDKICSLPRADEELRKLALWTEKTDGAFPVVRACFLPHPENRKRLYNPRLYDEWKKVEALKAKRHDAAQVRWQKPPRVATPIRLTDRSAAGFSSIHDEVQAITDKVFPPQ